MNSQREAELKPCPLCGGVAKEFDRVDANIVTCESCGCTVKQSELGRGDAAKLWNTRQAATEQGERCQILKGVGKINGDGWKDATAIGEVVYVWNNEKPKPYKPGQYPRVGNKSGWTASTEQYDFYPATIDEAQKSVESLRATQPPAEQGVGEPVAWLKFRSARIAADDVIEGLEIANAGEVGDDGGPAFPVYTHPPKPTGNESAHPDDVAVDNFAQAMKVKLAQAREKGKGGWDDKKVCPTKLLTSELWFHLFKGNEGTFEDIANFAMMLHQRGDSPEDLAVMAEHLTRTIPPLEGADKPTGGGVPKISKVTP